MKKCPYCAEEIQDEAIKCKHCRSDLSASRKEPVQTDVGQIINRSQRMARTFVLYPALIIVFFFIIYVLSR